MSLHEQYESPQFRKAKAIEAFDTVRSWHAKKGFQAFYGKEEPLPNPQIAREYLKAGISYFTNSDDKYLKPLGIETSAAIEQGRISISYPQVTSIPRRLQRECPTYSEKLFKFSILREPRGRILLESAYLTVSPSFVANAQKWPISVLAELATNLSMLRDFVNSRIISKSSVHIAESRSKATAAQLLHTAIREDFAIKDLVLRGHGILLTRYPRGIDSLPGGKYRSIQGDLTQNKLN